MADKNRGILSARPVNSWSWVENKVLQPDCRGRHKLDDDQASEAILGDGAAADFIQDQEASAVACAGLGDFVISTMKVTGRQQIVTGAIRVKIFPRCRISLQQQGQSASLGQQHDQGN